jgi:hypothetical protein
MGEVVDRRDEFGGRIGGIKQGRGQKAEGKEQSKGQREEHDEAQDTIHFA